MGTPKGKLFRTVVNISVQYERVTTWAATLQSQRVKIYNIRGYHLLYHVKDGAVG